MSSLNHAAPLVFLATDREMICRQASPNPRYPHAESEIWAPGRNANPTRPVRTDPRRLRRLPWVPPLASDSLAEDVRFWAFGGWLSFILFVVPVVYLYVFFRNGHFSLLSLAGLVPLVGLWLLFAILWPLNNAEIQPMWARLLLGLVALPVVTFVCFMSRILVSWRARSILIWSVVLLTTTLAWAGLTFLVPHSNAGGVTLPEERYGPDMWYLVFVGSSYMTGILIMLVFPFKMGILWLQSLSGRWSKVVQLDPKTLAVAETEVGAIHESNHE